MKEDKKINIVIPEGTKEMVFREDLAKKVYEPTPVKFEGVLLAPGDFMENRKKVLDAATANLTVDREKAIIVFTNNEKDIFKDVITGTLKKSSVVAHFGINQDDMFWEDKELAKFFRRAEFYFVDSAVHGRIVSSLMNFKAQINTVIENNKDQRGNVKHLLDKTVKNEVPESFIMRCPIFEGYPELTFEVLICAEADSQSVRFYLESPTLFKMEEEYKRELIDAEVKRFKEFGCAILYK